MKNIINAYIDSQQEEIYQLADELLMHPELGFKEFKTKEIIEKYLVKHGFTVDKYFSYTGLSVTIGSGKPHIGLIAEMDAIPTLGHPLASKIDNAAHACGHSSQMVVMLTALTALKDKLDKIDGTITLFFTPAEEFTDMKYRHELINEGKVLYASGKQDMLAKHLFDDVDLLIHLHASGQYHGYHSSIGCSLAGFIYKKITFLGKSAHASMAPSEGHNALNMFALFLSAVNMLRETFKEEDLIRFHGMVDKGGDTVNSIPSEVVYECYVRSDNNDSLLQLSKQVDKTAKCCAQALNGDCRIEDTPGYLPLNQSKELNDVLYPNIKQFFPDSEIKWGEKSTAAGDVGDISVFKPIVQFGYTGFCGTMHGKDLMIVDKEEVYLTQSKIVADTVYDLLNDHSLVDKVVSNYQPKMTYQQYLDYLNNKGDK